MFIRRYLEKEFTSVTNKKPDLSLLWQPLPRRFSSLLEPLQYLHTSTWRPVCDPLDLSWKDIELLISNRKEFEKQTMQYIDDIRKFFVQNVFNTHPQLEPPDIVDVVCKLSTLHFSSPLLHVLFFTLFTSNAGLFVTVNHS
jgi:hypothetical protein